MESCTTKAELAAALAAHRQAGTAIGFVPTMGALHEGHVSLVRQARAANATVVASIFVNPTQFGPHEDLARYPRTPKADTALLAASGVDVLFLPSVEEMYATGASTRISVGELGTIFEGASRPGHFDGVATVVAKLLHMVGPTRLYLGQKDAQQLAVVRRMVRDLDMPVEVVSGPTIREPDGLAMSSRNRFLTPEERTAAATLSRALRAVVDRWSAGEHSGDALRRLMTERVDSEPSIALDYANIVDPEAFEPEATAIRGSLLILAARIGSVRLIDNMPLDG